MDLARAASAWLRCQHPALRDDGERRLHARIRLLAGALGRRRDDEGVVRRFAEACPVPGVSHTDYALRVLDLGSDGHVIAGIHFYGMDVSRPFVGVLAAENPPGEAGRLEHMHGAILENFRPFGARVTRWSSGIHREAFLSCSGAWVDQHLLAAPVGRILASPAPARLSEVALIPVSDGWYQQYSSAWDEMMKADPSRASWLHKSGREALAACEVLVVVRVGGEPAGWLAASPGHIESIDGYVMNEQLLMAPFRGTGLAAAAQRRLCERLDDPARWLIGTIDAQNAPSLRTAARNGRWCVDSYWFVGARSGAWAG